MFRSSKGRVWGVTEVTAVDNRFGEKKAHLKAGTVLWAGKEKILRRGESVMG